MLFYPYRICFAIGIILLQTSLIRDQDLGGCEARLELSVLGSIPVNELNKEEQMNKRVNLETG